MDISQTILRFEQTKFFLKNLLHLLAPLRNIVFYTKNLKTLVFILFAYI